MPDERQMLDLSTFKIGALKDTPPGGLFLPIVEGGHRFLAGRLNQFPVLVVLEDDRGSAFRVAAAEQWSRKAGLHVTEGRFRVDPSTAAPIRDPRDAPPGSLVLSSLGPMIIAHDQNGMKAVSLAEGDGTTDLGDDAVAFGSWQYVVGRATDTQSLFAFSAST